MKTICITTGSLKGIGSEITYKALKKLKLKKNFKFIVFRSNKTSFVSFRKKAQTETVFSIKKALNSKSPIVDLVLKTSPAHWVYEAAALCNNKKAQALVTAPLSKTEIVSSGFKYAKGHTEILKKVSKSKNCFMFFLGNHFNVFLLTGHIPIKKVSSALKEKQMMEGVLLLKKNLRKLKNNKTLGFLGLNPHAGENAVIGKEEEILFKKVLKKLKSKRIKISPLLTPDVAFFKKNWKKYSCFVCSYHDQALIPFKSLNDPFKGVHISLGLPFVRTSVSHGSAFDLYGKNKAKEDSMKKAIQTAINLL